MGNILLMTRNIGPTEAALYEALQQGGAEVLVYDVLGSWVHTGQSSPLWMGGPSLRKSTMARHQMRFFLEEHQIEHVVASGLPACSMASAILERDFIALLWSTDLQFSPANVAASREFDALARTADRLFLVDDIEMGQAAAKNSGLPHLRIPELPVDVKPSLVDHEVRRVALLYPAHLAEGIHEFAADLSAELDVDVEALDINALFGAWDLRQGHTLQVTVNTRLKRFSHAAVIGHGSHHATVAQALANQRDRVVVEPSIANSRLYDRLGFTRIAKGMAIAPHLAEMLATPYPQPEPVEPSQTPEQREADGELPAQESHDELPAQVAPVAESSPAWLDLLLEADRREVPADFEELTVLDSDDPFSIYYAVSSLEERSNGARPMRIRNMYMDMEAEGPLLYIPPSAHALRRRRGLLQQLLADGRVLRRFYGENSTSPMPADVRVELLAFLQHVRDSGAASAWFVRDLHWLVDELGYVSDSSWLAQMRSDGPQELDGIAALVDVLAAPSVGSGMLFNELLGAAGHPGRTFVPLPPAVTPANVTPPRPQEGDETTILYVGGANSIYVMDTFLQALRDLPEEFRLDFIVREPEAAALRDMLESHGVEETHRIRILHTTLDRYRPPTPRCVGTVLLDGRYARNSFPYKTISQIERGFPILCYQDMEIAEFVTGQEVGLACERSVGAVREGLITLARDGAPGLERTQQDQTWRRRLDDLFTTVKGARHQ